MSARPYLIDGSEMAVPRTSAAALNPDWLSHALKPLTGGAPITTVEVVETLRTVATKIRFVAHWDGGSAALCLKAFLDIGDKVPAGPTSLIECGFYTDIAGELSVQVPTAVLTATDRDNPQGVLVMRDLVADGGRFCSALDIFSADDAAESLDQLARLHAGGALLDRLPWVTHQTSYFAAVGLLDQATLQELLEGPRGVGLPASVLSAASVIGGLKALAADDLTRSQTLVHGDAHAGNIFRTATGVGLIDWQLLQRGNWALDVAYHIAAVLPVEVAEQEEQRLLAHYLDCARRHGCATPGIEEALTAYRASLAWGYYLWAITRKVDPAITNVFVNRLGNAVARNDTFRLLAVPKA